MIGHARGRVTGLPRLRHERGAVRIWEYLAHPDQPRGGEVMISDPGGRHRSYRAVAEHSIGTMRQQIQFGTIAYHRPLHDPFCARTQRQQVIWRRIDEKRGEQSRRLVLDVKQHLVRGFHDHAGEDRVIIGDGEIHDFDRWELLALNPPLPPSAQRHERSVIRVYDKLAGPDLWQRRAGVRAMSAEPDPS